MRASQSATIISTAPSAAEPASWAPARVSPSSLARCGAIRPTKLSGPMNSADAAVSSAAARTSTDRAVRDRYAQAAGARPAEGHDVQPARQEEEGRDEDHRSDHCQPRLD